MGSAYKDRMFDSPTPVLEVLTPEWSECRKSYVRLLGGAELSAAQQLAEKFSREAESKPSNNGRMTDIEFAYRLFIVFVSDKDGASVFRESDLADVMKLFFKPVNRCMLAGLAFNGMTEEAAKDLRGKSTGVRRAKRG